VEIFNADLWAAPPAEVVDTMASAIENWYSPIWMNEEHATMWTLSGFIDEISDDFSEQCRSLPVWVCAMRKSAAHGVPTSRP
jgi:hypothetical protein